MLLVGGVCCAVLGALVDRRGGVLLLAVVTIFAVLTTILFGTAVRSTVANIALATVINVAVVQIVYCVGMAFRCWLLRNAKAGAVMFRTLVHQTTNH
jgi:hypothetical protein